MRHIELAVADGDGMHHLYASLRAKGMSHSDAMRAIKEAYDEERAELRKASAAEPQATPAGGEHVGGGTAGSVVAAAQSAAHGSHLSSDSTAESQPGSGTGGHEPAPGTDQPDAALVLEAYDALRAREGMDHAEAVAWFREVFPKIDIRKHLAHRSALVAAANGQPPPGDDGRAAETGSAYVDAFRALVARGMTPEDAAAYLRQADLDPSADLAKLGDLVAAVNGEPLPESACKAAEPSSAGADRAKMARLVDAANARH